MSKIKLFTHTDLDGVGCAILAYLVFGKENVDVEYCNYDDVNEKVEKFWKHVGDAEYDAVYITDISISEDLAEQITAHTGVRKWHLFDHHATALGLNKYDWCEVRVNGISGEMKTSGTEVFFIHLALNVYFKFKPTQENNLVRFVSIVRDYDTWKWKELGEEGTVCKQVNDLFHMYGREKFIDWAIDQICGTDYLSPLFVFPNFTETDIALLKQKQNDIDRYIETKDKQLFTQIDGLGNKYGVVFAEQYFSELGNRLCELHPELAYVAMIDVSDGTVSYRATRNDIDLGKEIASRFGGGGHPKAAGSQFAVEAVREKIVTEAFKER